MAKRKRLPSEIEGVRIVSDCGMGKLHTNSKCTTRNAMVECTICKNHRKVNVYSIRNGAGRWCSSCANKGTNNGAYKHGESDKTRTRTYTIWNGMRARCNNTGSKDYKNYGGRGIEVCTEWADYSVFKDWAGSRFEMPDSSIERKDVNIGYNPVNCTVIPISEQANNRRARHEDIRRVD